MNTRTKLAIITCTILVFITVASSFYLVGETNHICTGEDCPICVCIHQAEQTLRNLGTGNLVTSCIGIIIILQSRFALIDFTDVSSTSLVSRKVRLND